MIMIIIEIAWLSFGSVRRSRVHSRLVTVRSSLVRSRHRAHAHPHKLAQGDVREHGTRRNTHICWHQVSISRSFLTIKKLTNSVSLYKKREQRGTTLVMSILTGLSVFLSTLLSVSRFWLVFLNLIMMNFINFIFNLAHSNGRTLRRVHVHGRLGSSRNACKIFLFSIICELKIHI